MMFLKLETEFAGGFFFLRKNWVSVFLKWIGLHQGMWDFFEAQHQRDLR